jgi:predicted nuclease of predicted toxin-antitoxin system
MARFLVDEDMPRSTAPVLRQVGHEAEDVRDIGLGGHGDPDVFAAAQQRRACLITRDLGFSNALRFPVGTHAGIITMRVPSDVPPPRLNRELLGVLSDLGDEDLGGLLVIIEIGRRRIRRPSADNP